jgi:hypothetical protein
LIAIFKGLFNLEINHGWFYATTRCWGVGTSVSCYLVFGFLIMFKVYSLNLSAIGPVLRALVNTTALVTPSVMLQVLPITAESLYPCLQPYQAASCTIPAGTSTYGAQIKYFSPVASSGANAPSGYSYTLNNDTNITSEGVSTNEVLSIVVGAGGGHDEDGFHSATNGGPAGTVTINTTGNLDMDLFTYGQAGHGDNQRGLWDRDGSMFVIRAASVGGQGGGDIDTGVGGGSGGDGGGGVQQPSPIVAN